MFLGHFAVALASKRVAPKTSYGSLLIAAQLGSAAFWGLMAFLVLAYAGASFGPPPPNARAIGITGLLCWLLAPWAYWIDRNRDVRAGSE